MQHVGTCTPNDAAQIWRKGWRKWNESKMCLNFTMVDSNVVETGGLAFKAGPGVQADHGNIMAVMHLLLCKIGNETFHSAGNGGVIFTDMQYFHLLKRQFRKRCLCMLPRNALVLLLLLTFLGCMAGCAAEIRRPDALDSFIQNYSADERIFQEDYFDLLTILKGRQGERLRVYIEGDGLAWLDRYTVSPDPTPRTPTALELASRDPFPLILYLARPCQYVRDVHRRNCLPQFWTSARFAEPVVADLNTVIDQVAARTGATSVELVGYSGGGGLAVLVAARRNDVAGILTLAGNLDHQAWTDLHGVSPLRDSLNPKCVAAQVADVPQVHVVGSEDSTVPVSVLRSYMTRGASDVTQTVVLDGVEHTTGWIDVYPAVLEMFDQALTFPVDEEYKD